MRQSQLLPVHLFPTAVSRKDGMDSLPCPHLLWGFLQALYHITNTAWTAQYVCLVDAWLPYKILPMLIQSPCRITSSVKAFSNSSLDWTFNWTNIGTKCHSLGNGIVWTRSLQDLGYKTPFLSIPSSSSIFSEQS